MSSPATMQFKVLALFLAVLLLLSNAGRSTALGINCRGSSQCGGSHTLSQINTIVQGLPDSNVYSNGQHIACVGRLTGQICAFLQNVSGTKTGAQIKGFVQALLQHGCTACGSDPTEPGNDVNFGELTVNYVA